MILRADIAAPIGATGHRLKEIRQASMNGGRLVTNRTLKSVADPADTPRPSFPSGGGTAMTSRQPRGWQEIHPRDADADAFRLAAILASSPDAIIARSPDGELTDWNPGENRD
jgi:PAS domain-containing protein